MVNLWFTQKDLRYRWAEAKKDFGKEFESYLQLSGKRLLEESLKVEQHLVGAGRYQRSTGRRGYRNGYYARNSLTTYGWIEGLEVPRMRQTGFDSLVFEKYRRRQRVIDRVLLEAFLFGLATRKVRRLVKSLFGSEISPQAVSNVVHELDEEVSAFHQRRFERSYQGICQIPILHNTLDRIEETRLPKSYCHQTNCVLDFNIPCPDCVKTYNLPNTATKIDMLIYLTIAGKIIKL